MGIFKFFKEGVEYLVGDCGTCKHQKNCPYIEEGKGSCFDISGFEPHYEKRK